MEVTNQLNLVGVSFWENPSLSMRYKSYLSNITFTCLSTLLYSSTSCVVVATNKIGTMDPLEWV